MIPRRLLWPRRPLLRSQVLTHNNVLSQTRRALSVGPTKRDASGELSPAVRHLFLQHKIDQKPNINGSGKDGRLTKEDVLKFLGIIKGPVSQKTVQPTQTVKKADQQVKYEEITRETKFTTENPKNVVPHFWLTIGVPMENLIRYQKELNLEAEKSGLSLTLRDFLVRSVAVGLKEVPEANAVWNGEEIQSKLNCDVVVELSTPNGRKSAVIRSLESKGLLDIAQETKKAEEGGDQRVPVGSYSVSEVDVISGIDILREGQTGHVTLGSLQQVPKILPDGTLATSTVSVLALVCDQRAVDGETAGKLLESLKNNLSTPHLLA